MMKVVIDRLPEIDFLISEKNNVSPILKGLTNVIFSDGDNGKKYPTLLVTGSGFMLNSSAAVKSELISLLKGRGVADYCLGCNMEPLDSSFKQWLIKRKMSRFKLIVCRDKKSFSWISENVKGPKVAYLPDILFSLPDTQLIRGQEGKKLGISLMHRNTDTESCEYYKAMADIADFWIETTGENVVLMAFDSGEENDVYSCECVKKIASHPEKIEIAIHRNGNEIFEAYSECCKIISTRYHSAVLALRLGIPFYPIVFRQKMKNLIDDMAYPVKGCEIDKISLEGLKEFLLKETQYELCEKVVSDSLEYTRIFKESLSKDSEIQ